MKRILTIILTVAFAAACTKSSIELEQGDQISMSPVADNMTKAAQSGAFPQDWHIAVWAYLGSAAASDSPDVVVNYANFDYPYFAGQEFSYQTEKRAASWAGLLEPYFWPGHGSLVFAGFSLPAPATAGTQSNPSWREGATYEFYNYPAEGVTETLNNGLVDKFTITDYVQSSNTASTFDLMWFGITRASYNYRTSGTPVAITFNHALSWITFQVKGDGAPAAEGTAWQVESLVMEDVKTKGDVVCVGKNAVWSGQETPADMTVFTGSEALTTSSKVLETTANGTLVIPQKPGMLTVKFTSGGKQTTKTVNLKLTDDEDDPANLWKPGYHYTYTLLFRANEILVAPSFGAWGEDLDNTITVQ